MVKHTKVNQDNLDICGLIVFSPTFPMVFSEIWFLSFDELEKLQGVTN